MGHIMLTCTHTHMKSIPTLIGIGTCVLVHYVCVQVWVRVPCVHVGVCCVGVHACGGAPCRCTCTCGCAMPLCMHMRVCCVHVRTHEGVPCGCMCGCGCRCGCGYRCRCAVPLCVHVRVHHVGVHAGVCVPCRCPCVLDTGNTQVVACE